MSVGLLAVVDDILSAALKASAKSAGVVIDDAAVTPQYVQGITPARELPVVARIGLGSLGNKFLVIIPIALALTAFAPGVLPYLLIVGGAFLCFEGAEKVLEWFGVGHAHADDGPRDERKLVWGAIRTDLILSSEIMLISLSNLDDDTDFWRTVGVLSIIAVIMTVVVYGAVALLVKIDDMGLRAMKSASRSVRRLGARVVASMPAVFRVIGVVGTIAMLWVGGHLVLENVGEVGLVFTLDLLHGVEHLLDPAGGAVAWFGVTLVSAIAGVLVGLVIVGALTALRRVRGGGSRPVGEVEATPGARP